MRKIVPVLLCIVFTTLNGYAQTEEQLEGMMTRRALTCADIELNLQSLLPDLYVKGDTAMIRSLMQYAAKKCPYAQPVLSFSLLYAIASDSFDISMYNGYELNWELQCYLDQAHGDTTKMIPYGFHAWRPEKEMSGSYCTALQAMASGLSGRHFKTDFEQQLIAYYSHPTKELLEQLKKTTGSKAARIAYNDRIANLRLGKSGFNYALYSGVWIPGAGLAVVGMHPYIGIHYGGGTGKFLINLSIAARFIKAADSFSVKRVDSLHRSRTYGGGYFGIDGSYAVLRGKKHQLDLEAGIALETLKNLDIEQEHDNDNIIKRLYSPNFNLGAGYKYWFNRGYIGLDIKYNLLFFRNRGGTDFSGNVLTIGLVFGGISFNR